MSDEETRFNDIVNTCEYSSGNGSYSQKRYAALQWARDEIDTLRKERDEWKLRAEKLAVAVMNSGSCRTCLDVAQPMRFLVYEVPGGCDCGCHPVDKLAKQLIPKP